MNRLSPSYRLTSSLYGLVLLLLLAACGEATLEVTPGEDNEGIINGVDVDALFAPPTTAEIDAVQADWADRDLTPQEVEVVETFATNLGDQPATARVIAHTVDEARHFGLLIVPDGAAPGSLPVVVYAHGGDGGAGYDDGSLDGASFLLPLSLGNDWGQYAYVIPSFRAEPLRVQDRVYESTGTASPWDRDVDDALHLLNIMLDTTPEVDPDRIGVLGYSRGSGVALLMAARDTRIARVVGYFGPTDFFGTYVRRIASQALRGTPQNLPGLDILNETVLTPLVDNTLSIDEARFQLALRSPVYVADRLPFVQLHHGFDDSIVDVSQTQRMTGAMEELGRTAPEYEAYLYVGGTHNPLSLPGATERSAAYMGGLLTDAPAARLLATEAP